MRPGTTWYPENRVGLYLCLVALLEQPTYAKAASKEARFEETKAVVVLSAVAVLLVALIAHLRAQQR